MKPSVNTVLVFLGAVAALLISSLLGVLFGATSLSIGAVTEALWVDKDGLYYHIIMNVRLPRVLLAGLVGTALSLSGAILQGIMRNPLASPNIIGVTSGAGLTGTLFIVVLPELIQWLPIAAFIGALVTTLVIYVIAYDHGIAPMKMVLAGIAVSSLVNACIHMIHILYPDSIQDTLSFTIGSLNLALWKDVRMMIPYVVIGFIVCILSSRALNMMMLGDAVARSLGIPVEGFRFIMIVTASLLAAASVSAVGLLGFVGLIVPHITRLIIGSDYRYLFPLSAILGATLVILCDMVARIMLAPVEVPVGILLAGLGVPFFLFLLRRKPNHDFHG